MKLSDSDTNLDIVFEALASKHRRAIIFALGLQPHSVSQLAMMRDLSLPAIHKHIRLLKDAQLVQDKKIGRTHVLTLNRQSLLRLQDWLMQFQAYWGTSSESLENYVQYVETPTKMGGEKK